MSRVLAANDPIPRERSGLRELVGRSWPMWLVAFSLNGFFTYLAVLDVVGVAPATRITAVYYGVLCVALLATAWHRRMLLAALLRPRRRTVVVFVLAASFLSAWFVINTTLLSTGGLAYRLAGLLLLWSVPTALVAASFDRAQLREVALGLVAIALLFVAIDAIGLARAGTHVFRFAPIEGLDPISAGLIPGLGAVAALSLQPQSTRARALQLLTIIVLVSAAVVPGSRGPVLALAITALILAVVQRSRSSIMAIVGVTLGLAVGSSIGSHIGSAEYLTGAVAPPRVSTASTPISVEPISTLSIRRQWLKEAIDAAPDRPIFGHGVGMLIDNTPEARRMGVSGQRTYPHNTFVEAAYSLGLIGVAAYVLFLGTAAIAMVSVMRRNRHDPAVVFALGIAAFAFVNTNISGEIGEDVLLWSSAVIAIVLYADACAATASER